MKTKIEERRELVLEAVAAAADWLLSGAGELALAPGEIRSALAAMEPSFGEVTFRFQERLRQRVPPPGHSGDRDHEEDRPGGD